MLYRFEELARQHTHESRARAAYERVANRQYAAQRWNRLAAWSAHRSAMADRASREAYAATRAAR